MTKIEYENILKLSSIPLRKLNSHLMPVSMASGCLIEYEGKKILLTVQHATGDFGDWAAEIRLDSQKGMEMHRLGAMNFLKMVSLTTLRSEDVDFAYTTVPVHINPVFQKVDQSGNILSEIPRHICDPIFKSEPDRNESFGFSGHILPSRLNNFLLTDLAIYTELKYKGVQEDYYVFELPFQHPGHKYFKGCSGAPIIDTKGKLVALVCSGDEDKNLIYGISLRKYEIAIDATYGKLSRIT